MATAAKETAETLRKNFTPWAKRAITGTARFVTKAGITLSDLIADGVEQAHEESKRTE